MKRIHECTLEHLWFDLDISIRAATLLSRNVRYFQDLLTSAWYQIPEFVKLISR